jgi:hypothetical protein
LLELVSVHIIYWKQASLVMAVVSGRVAQSIATGNKQMTCTKCRVFIFGRYQSIL